MMRKEAILNKTGRFSKRAQILIPVWIFLIIFIIVLLIIIPSTREEQPLEEPQTEQVETQAQERNVEELAANAEITKSSDEELNDFFKGYYDALAKGDDNTLSAMFDEPSVAVSSDAMASLIDEYRNFTVYSAEGLNPDEYAVFVYNDVKFKNIDTVAPSVDSFYVSKASGTYKIVSDMYYNVEIADYLTFLSVKDPVKEIMVNTDVWLQSSLEIDKQLAEIYEQMKNAISASGD